MLVVLVVLLLLLLSTSVVVPPVSAASTSPRLLSTPIALSRIGNYEGVSRPAPQLLLPRLHLPVRAEHDIFKGLGRRLCIDDQKALLHSNSGERLRAKCWLASISGKTIP